MPEAIDRRIMSAEVQDKLDQSKLLTEHLEVRVIQCPVCGYRLIDVFGYDHYLVRVKCRKCKFEEVIDTAYFRTMQKKRKSK